MNRPKIADLLRAILVIAACLASLRSASATGAGAMSVLTVGVLLWAVLGAAFRRGESRASWCGFALFGATYYVASSLPWLNFEVGRWLPTSRLLDEVYARTWPAPAQAAPGRLEFWDYANREYIKLGPYSFWVEGRDHFRRGGHAVLTLVVGLLGGLAGRDQWRRSATLKESA